jgi:hypothetical protein
MGIYLSTPKTEKASEDGENGMLRYGLSSMQGWRASMEDAVTILFFWFLYFCLLVLYAAFNSYAFWCFLMQHVV